MKKTARAYVAGEWASAGELILGKRLHEFQCLTEVVRLQEAHGTFGLVQVMKIYHSVVCQM